MKPTLDLDDFPKVWIGRVSKELKLKNSHERKLKLKKGIEINYSTENRICYILDKYWNSKVDIFIF